MAFTGGLITAIQKNMITLFEKKASVMARTNTGYLDAVKSNYNRQGVKMKVNEGAGGNKKRTVQLITQKRWLESDVTETLLCVDEVASDQDETDVPINKVVQTKWQTFSEVDLRDIMTGEKAFMNTGLLGMFDAATVKLNKAILTLQAAGFGQWLGAGAIHSEDWIYADDSLRVAGETLMMNDYQDSNGFGRPIIVGKANLTQYWLRKGVGATQAIGYNAAQFGDFVYHKDINAQLLGVDANGDSAAVVLNPGSVHLVDAYNTFVGDGQKTAENVFIHGTVLDPRSGILWDIAVEYGGATDACTPSWRIKLIKHYALYIPTAAKLWKVGDPLAAVNGSFKLEVKQA